MITGIPERMYHISHTQLSVARHYGGCNFNGKYYVYEPDTDSLVREDVLKAERKKQPPATRDKDDQ